MTINPFDLLKNAQKLQEQLGSFTEKLRAITVTGSSGGGMVEIDINCTLEVEDVRIAPELAGDAIVIQDLVKAALGVALDKVRKAVTQEISQAAGGMGGGNGFPINMAGMFGQ
jgi:DNA-binding YbaB/EbfC family protein